MSRDDSILYAGSSSASFGSPKEQQIRTDIRENKREKRAKLQPAAEVVFAEIKSEMDSVMFIQNIAVEEATDERMFMIEVMARKKYVTYLKNLQNKLDIILRDK
jgi:hypothetical protein